MTDIVTPPTIDAMPPAPQPTDTREQFNAKAFPHAAAQQTLVTQVNASAAATNQNAIAANERATAANASAGTAATKRDEAVAAAGTATTKRDEAVTAAGQAEASRIEASKLNLGAKAAAPTVDNQGQALRTGATYYDTTLNKWRAWNGTLWVEPVNVTGAVSTVNGKSGPDVTLLPSDLGALPATGAIAVGGSVRAPRVAVAALAIDCSTGNYFAKTIAANSTFTFGSAPASGNAYGMSIDVTHTSGVITWPTSVKWPGDMAPSLTAGKVHKFLFTTSDGGATWRGAALSNYAS
ncbi:MAG: hypothetical protein EOO31_10750 [Comamonadaceae bacterium]|nr:MAG: hypothetical protein EOO31_10750 [Comamonadaceae bacterium]